MPELEVQTILLQRLRAADRIPGPGWIPAREIAAQLDVTLNAVHQAVRRLRLAGWNIDTTSRGVTAGLCYRLAKVGTPPLPAGADAADQLKLSQIYELMHQVPPLTELQIAAAFAELDITLADVLRLSAQQSNQVEPSEH